MPDYEKILIELSRQLQQATEGLTPIEAALLLADMFRKGYGTEWVIDAHADGGFTVRRR